MLHVERKDYKLAVRYLFLKSLKLLSEKEIIELRNNKTNHQYLSEIKNSKFQKHFKLQLQDLNGYGMVTFLLMKKVMKSSQNDFNELFGLIAS